MLAYEVTPGAGRVQPDTEEFVFLKGASGRLNLICHQNLPFWKKPNVPDTTPHTWGRTHWY